MCHFEGYENCVYPWDVLRGASNSSDIYAAKKGARRKQQFLDAFAKSRNAHVNFIMSVLPSLRLAKSDLRSPLTDFHEIQNLIL